VRRCPCTHVVAGWVRCDKRGVCLQLAGSVHRRQHLYLHLETAV
jgi:hypothetical protein